MLTVVGCRDRVGGGRDADAMRWVADSTDVSRDADSTNVAGIGSVAAEMLTRSGIGKLLLFDYDNLPPLYKSIYHILFSVVVSVW